MAGSISQSAAGTVVQSGAGSISHAAAGTVVQSAAGSVVQGTVGSVVSSVQQPPNSSGIKVNMTTGSGSGSASGAAKTAVKPPSPPRMTAPSKPANVVTTKTVGPTATARIGQPGGAHATVTHVAAAPPRIRTIVRTRTKVVVHTRTIVHRVVKVVAPKVPSGAFLPSRHPVLAQSGFVVPGANISCQLSGVVHCAVVQRTWAAPRQPRNCSGSWGDVITLRGTGPGTFLCMTGRSAGTGGQVIPVGWDDKVGRFTCEVRSFGVNCFSASGGGFIISRTGYQLY